jgi:carboxylesterase type B
MLLYVPTTLKANSGVPTLLWIHGGSFIAGSATAPGLDGSKLAIATNSIVAVMQYRLGALGFMAPSGATNLAVKDTINAMNFLAKVVPSFGGSVSKITLAGQSSGAGMIRALLATPSASSLFQSAILQSDPIVSFIPSHLVHLLTRPRTTGS